ncbi:MAG: Trehalose transport system permease protein SugB [Actinomycetota bacterium]|jgi:raffinose/stachyose/melibiose transport system permease protein
MTREKTKAWIWGSVALVIAVAVFFVPFAFIFLTASKDAQDSLLLQFSLPKHWQIWQNIVDVVQANHFMLPRAFFNSILLSVCSVTILVFLCSMAAYIIVRRPGRVTKVANGMLLAGLMIPPAVVPTIFIMQGLHIYGSFPGMILIEVAYNSAFTVMIFRAFISTIPKELDEAAIIDGAGPFRLYFSVIFPLLRSVTVTAIILNSVNVFNDFTQPLYYLNGPGSETVQLTLFNFTSQFNSSYNLLFMDILLVTVPMVIMFAFFNKRIVAGMTAGAVKG